MPGESVTKSRFQKKKCKTQFCHSIKPRGACLRTEICEGLKHLAARVQKVLLYVTRGHLALAPGAFVFSFSRPYQIGFHSRAPGDMQRNRCGKGIVTLYMLCEVEGCGKRFHIWFSFNGRLGILLLRFASGIVMRRLLSRKSWDMDGYGEHPNIREVNRKFLKEKIQRIATYTNHS